VSGPGWTGYARPSAPLRILRGGDPGAERLTALAVAVTALVEGERPPAAADPAPAAYRSRWRRAALLEASEVPSHVKHDGRPWGVH
jgi:hypothetical protein